MEVFEERCVSQVAVKTRGSNIRERQEQLCEAGALRPEEVGVVVEDSPCLEEFVFVHEPTLSRDFRPSWNGRGSPPSHSPA